MKLRLLFSFIIVVLIGTTIPPKALAADSLSWGTYSISDGTTISGIQRLSVTSNTSNYISKWCIYLDGAPLSGRHYESDYVSPGPTRNSVYFAYRMIGSQGAPNQSSPGCWLLPSTNGPNGLIIQIDTSTWTNGTHTFTIEATSSLGDIHSKSVSLISSNTLPAVEWINASGLILSDFGSLTARITPGGAPRIIKACVLRNGTPVSLSDNFYLAGDTDYGNIPSNPGPDGRFGTSSGGCTTFDDFQNNSSPVGLHQVTNLSITFPTTPWMESSANIQIQIEDAIGRTFSTQVNLGIANSVPTSSTPQLQGTTVWETLEFPITLTQSQSTLQSVCVNGTGIPAASMSIRPQSVSMPLISNVNGCWTSQTALDEIKSGTAKLNLNTYSIPNGAQTLTIIAKDVLGRNQPVAHNFVVNNGFPTASLTGISNGSTVNGWLHPRVRSSLPVHMSRTSISTSCIQVPMDSSCFGGNPYDISKSFNSSCVSNGVSTVSSTTVDSGGRTVSNSVTFAISNTKPSTPRIAVTQNKPLWSHKSTSGTVALNGAGGCDYKIFIRAKNSSKVLKTFIGLFDSENPNSVSVSFTGLKPSTSYVIQATINNRAGKSERTHGFKTSSIPPKPKASLMRKLCPIGIRMDLCVSRLRAYPSTFDCTGTRRSWIVRMEFGTSFWIIGYTSGTPVISEHPRICL